MKADTSDRVQEVLGKRTATLQVEQSIEPYRKVESWLFGTAAEPMPVELRSTLLGVHMTAQDYFASHPFLILPLTKKLSYGEIYQDVFLLEPGESVPSPREIHHFLANGTFMRECLKQCITIPVVDGDDEVVRIHSLDAIEVLFGSDFQSELARQVSERGLMCIGVVGTDPIHATRGKIGGSR